MIPIFRRSKRREVQPSARTNEESVNAVQAYNGEDAWATDNLEFHGLAVQLDSPNLEVNANSTDVALGVGVVRKPEEQTGLHVCKFHRVLSVSHVSQAQHPL